MSQQEEYINPNAQGHYNNAAMEIIGKAAATTLAALTNEKENA